MNESTKELLLEELIKITNKSLKNSILNSRISEAEIIQDEAYYGFKDPKKYIFVKAITAATDYFCKVERELNIDVYSFRSDKDLKRKVILAFANHISKISKDNVYEPSQRIKSTEKIVQNTSDYLINVIYPYCSQRAAYSKNFPPLKPSQFSRKRTPQ